MPRSSCSIRISRTTSAGLRVRTIRPGRGAIERVDRAERTGTRAAAAGQDRHDVAAQHRVGLVIALGIRQLIEILDQRPRRRRDHA